MTVQEYAARNPQLMPDRKYREDLSASSVPEPPIAAIILLDDPEDWHEGLQVCLDVLRTDGSLGPRHEVKRQAMFVEMASLIFLFMQEVLLFAGNPVFIWFVLPLPSLTNTGFRVCKCPLQASNHVRCFQNVPRNHLQRVNRKGTRSCFV